jgi:hypothetical protein
LEFVKATGFADPRRFSFFADAPKPVRDWIDRDEGNKKKYFELITPQNGIQRIRSVATKGGLRDFQKIIGYDTVLREFLDDKDLTAKRLFPLGTKVHG